MSHRLEFSSNQGWPSGLAWLVCLLLILVLGGCDSEPSPPSSPPSVISSRAEPSISISSSTVRQDTPRIVAFGDSLTAGLGVAQDQSYPAQLQAQLDQAGYHYRVINAGVSGDTTAGGLRRLDWVLKSKPAIVIIELGVNDALRGQPLAAMTSNLSELIVRLQDTETTVVLAGMKIPPNYGLDYTTGFESMFALLANKHGVTLIPFLLEGVAARPGLNQADGIHPTSAGYEIVADTVMASLAPLLKNPDSR